MVPASFLWHLWPLGDPSGPCSAIFSLADPPSIRGASFSSWNVTRHSPASGIALAAPLSGKVFPDTCAACCLTPFKCL